MVNTVTTAISSDRPEHHAEKMGAVSRVATGLSHDVGELVELAAASIRGVLGSLPAEDDSRQQLEDAAQALVRAALIARQLEVLSRSAPSRPAPRALGRTVSELLPLSSRLAGPEVSIHAGELDASAWISADAGQIEQVMFHLVVNARDAMPSGGRLGIAVRSVELEHARLHRYGILPAGKWSVLELRDTGVGMSDAVMSRLFEPFFTTKAPGLGSGLGLATVYGIARQLGGQVVVESSEGFGTTVSLWIPAGEPAPEPAGHVDGAAVVLVVDRDEWVRAVAARSLRRAGYGVLEASDVVEALNLLGDVAGKRVRTVLADLGTPGISGRGLVTTVAERWPAVRVVLMSGCVPDSAAPENLPAGVLRKPFTRTDLLAAIAG
jgi:nitrogen-specific signal transduction histidine kinase/CheY-like chemotaxis protein